MENHQCDFSPMKKKVKQQLQNLSQRMSRVAEVLEEENHCILSEVADIKKGFLQMESIASAFYLQYYLSPFTNIYIDLSLSIQRLSERRHGALIVVSEETGQSSFAINGKLYPFHAQSVPV